MKRKWIFIAVLFFIVRLSQYWIGNTLGNKDGMIQHPLLLIMLAFVYSLLILAALAFVAGKHLKKQCSTPLLLILILIGFLIIAEGISRSQFFDHNSLYSSALLKNISDVKMLYTREKPPPGRWTVQPKDQGSDLSSEQKEAIRKLQSIGYLSGSQEAPENRNVSINKRSKTAAGYNLVVSGHTTGAFLMDMEGEKLHNWSCSAQRAWPDLDQEQENNHTGNHSFWRRVHLFKNGNLLAIFEGIGIIKLDKDSNLIWKNKNGAHHDLYVDKNNNIYLLTRKAHIRPEYHETEPILEDYICILDSLGQQIMEISILDLLADSKYAPVLRRMYEHGDILHTNTIELIEEEPPSTSPFRAGTLLISILHLDLVCAVDLNRRSIYWAESDLWFRQHQPTLLPGGHLLVFDNQGRQGRSTVLEIDPTNRDIVWFYRGNEEHPFYTYSCGSCQRLGNGNTLITESDPGRAFEVTANKEIVWEYINPHRAGSQKNLIATLFEIIRLENFSLHWLE